MALLPLAVKTSIEKYTDTFTRIPNVGNGIIELFVQNNYLNTSVSKRVDASEVGIEKNKMTIASDKLISRVQNNAYITVETKTYNKETKKTETSYKLYRRDLIYTDTDAKGNEVITKITYTEIPTLGNKSNYLEFTSKPTIETKTSIEESDSEDMKNPTTDYDATDDGPVDNITDLIVKSLINKGLTEEEAYKKIAENKEPSAKERNQKNIENIKNFFRNQLTKMNIPFDESLVEEMAKEFC
jgi:5S rRNA maturation endonuclease (ribonuclease M5)